MEKKGNMTDKEALLKILPKELPIEETTGSWFNRGCGAGHTQALSDTLTVLTDRVATMEEINEIVWDTIQCALDKGNYRAGGREELEQIFLDIEIPEKTTQALQKEFVILKREVKDET